MSDVSQGRVLRNYYAALTAAERDVDVDAVRKAHHEYLRGALEGAAISVIGGVLVAWVAARASHHHLTERPFATALACAAAGVVGTCVSVSWRVTAGDPLRLDIGSDPNALRMLGRLRPGIGGAFGVALYFALKSGFINIGSENRNFYFFALFAFVGGFSERVVPDLIRSAEKRLRDQPTPPPQATPGAVNDPLGPPPPPG